MLSESTLQDMKDYLSSNGTKLRKLVHGAMIYDWRGQNICLNDCLTIDPTDNSIRQLIFFPDGHVRYDWQHPGATLF